MAWIRSQDRSMVLDINRVLVEKEGAEYLIRATVVSGWSPYIVGKFSTFENAMKELDEIVSWLNNDITYAKNGEYITGMFANNVYHVNEDV